MSLYKILPQFVARPWGRRTLEPLFSLPPEEDRPIGEVWLTSLECQVEGAETGRELVRLGEFWRALPAEKRGPAVAAAGRFPLLVKLLFTAEKLSIQVHPDDEYARREAGEPWGKTEAWHVLAAEPEAWVLAGFRPGIGAEQISSAWGGPELEALMNRITLSAGDTVLIPAGTLHSVGPGLCLCEIQQYSDVTYRVYDYERPGLDGKRREMHFEQAREVTQFATPDAGLVHMLDRKVGDVVEKLVTTPYFSVDKWPPGAAQSEADNDSEESCFTLTVVLQGRGSVNSAGSAFAYQPCDTFLLTAGAERLNWQPEESTEFLRIRPVGLG